MKGIDYLFAEAVSELSFMSASLFDCFEYEFDSRELNQDIAREASAFLIEYEKIKNNDEPDYLELLQKHYEKTIEAKYKPLCTSVKTAFCKAFRFRTGLNSQHALEVLAKNEEPKTENDINSIITDHMIKYDLADFALL